MISLIFLYYFCVFYFIVFCFHLLHFSFTYVEFSVLFLLPPFPSLPLLLFILLHFLRWKLYNWFWTFLLYQYEHLKLLISFYTPLAISYRFWYVVFSCLSKYKYLLSLLVFPSWVIWFADIWILQTYFCYCFLI